MSKRPPPGIWEVYEVKVWRPEGVTIAEMRTYIKDAVGAWASGGDPSSPLFGGATRPSVKKQEQKPK